MNSLPAAAEKSKNRVLPEGREECGASPPAPDKVPSNMAAGLTLEQLIDLTGELGHLNELVMIHIKDSGGFTNADGYFRIVQPILDRLEAEIRSRCQPGMSVESIKRVVQDWIDKEIAALKTSGAK